MFICMAHGLFEDIILNNLISISELPPFTMNDLRCESTVKNISEWKKLKKSQYQSAICCAQHMEDVPSMEEILAITREAPLQWNPLQNFVQYDFQSNESFYKQKQALQFNINAVNNFRSTSGPHASTYTKNVITYGAPGTGKSFVGQLVLLYVLSQGMNIIATSLMGVRANALGGIHLHKLFGLPHKMNANSSPINCAKASIEKIKRNPILLFLILTLDALFIDELAQKSAQQIATIDIVLRTLRESQLPFGGVFIIASMDNTQIQPINQLPFLTSTLVLTCFHAVRLQHSVRAHGDIDFQRLQAITRMCPFVLRESSELKNEFFELAGRIFTYVPDWNDEIIGPNMMRVFSKKNSTRIS